jgi:superfamily II RNA helicase
MMNGKPQKLISKFKISYNLILNLIATNNNNNNIVSKLVEYSKKSMIQYDLDNKATGLTKQLADLEAEASRLEEAVKTITIPSKIMDEYVRLIDMLPFTVNKKRKECERDLQKITNEYKNIANERALLKKFIDKKKEIVVLNKSINDNQYYLDYNVDRVLHVLADEQLLEPDININQLTIRGQIAASIRELPCLPFAAIIEDGSLNLLTEYDLVCVFSCFTNVTVGEEWSTTCLSNVETSEDVKSILKILDLSFEKFMDIETRLMLDTGVDYSKHYNMIEYAYEWAQAENVEQCKWVLQLAAEEKEIFLGEFVKAILKIVAIAAELESIAEMLGQIDFLFKLRQIPTLLMKYVATNQSLYI